MCRVREWWFPRYANVVQKSTLFLVFSVIPFKIKVKTVQKLFKTVQWKSRISETKEGNYAETLAEIQVTAIFPLQDMLRSSFPQIYSDLYGDVMFVPFRMGTNMAAGNQQKHLSLSFATKGEIYLSRNSKTIKIIIFPIQELFSPEISHLLNTSAFM